jgi:hypothetical protein
LKAGADLGEINWADAAASSFSELVANLGLDIKSDILDERIATALLTGVVAATDQFRNDKTTPDVMSLSGKLMAAGANQQLIASELAAGVQNDGTKTEPNLTAKPESSTVSIDHNTDAAAKKSDKKSDGSEPAENSQTKNSESEKGESEPKTSPRAETAADALKEAEDELSAAMKNAAPTGIADDLKADLAGETAAPNSTENFAPSEPTANSAAGKTAGQNLKNPLIKSLETPGEKMTNRPAFDEPASADIAQAEADKAARATSDDGKPLLSHGAPVGEKPAPNIAPAQPTATPMIQNGTQNFAAASTLSATPNFNPGSNNPTPNSTDNSAPSLAASSVAPNSNSALPPYLPPPPPLPDFAKLAQPPANGVQPPLQTMPSPNQSSNSNSAAATLPPLPTMTPGENAPINIPGSNPPLAAPAGLNFPDKPLDAATNVHPIQPAAQPNLNNLPPPLNLPTIEPSAGQTLPPPPPFSNNPSQSSSPTLPNQNQPSQITNNLPPLPSLAPTAAAPGQMSTAPANPPQNSTAPLGQIAPPASPLFPEAAPPPADPSDPGAFHIPGQ